MFADLDVAPGVLAALVVECLRQLVGFVIRPAEAVEIRTVVRFNLERFLQKIDRFGETLSALGSDYALRRDSRLPGVFRAGAEVGRSKPNGASSHL